MPCLREVSLLCHLADNPFLGRCVACIFQPPFVRSLAMWFKAWYYSASLKVDRRSSERGTPSSGYEEERPTDSCNKYGIDGDRIHLPFDPNPPPRKLSHSNTSNASKCLVHLVYCTSCFLVLLLHGQSTVGLRGWCKHNHIRMSTNATYRKL